jgi:hypothetical protein
MPRKEEKNKLKVVKGKTGDSKTSRNPLTRSPVQPSLHPSKPEADPKNVKRLRIVKDKDKDPDGAA